MMSSLPIALREEAHGAVKAEAPEPSQQFLGAMREDQKPTSW
ncbi:MAG TPA: hypothetical protein VFX36_04625 [Nitrospira sp.]|nr:hypothetical protein [Nitrospira sp.]